MLSTSSRIGQTRLQEPFWVDAPLASRVVYGSRCLERKCMVRRGTRRRGADPARCAKWYLGSGLVGRGMLMAGSNTLRPGGCPRWRRQDVQGGGGRGQASSGCPWPHMWSVTPFTACLCTYSVACIRNALRNLPPTCCNLLHRTTLARRLFLHRQYASCSIEPCTSTPRDVRGMDLTRRGQP